MSEPHEVSLICSVISCFSLVAKMNAAISNVTSSDYLRQVRDPDIKSAFEATDLSTFQPLFPPPLQADMACRYL